jgi:hypothetical protein
MAGTVLAVGPDCTGTGFFGFLAVKKVSGRGCGGAPLVNTYCPEYSLLIGSKTD